MQEENEDRDKRRNSSRIDNLYGAMEISESYRREIVVSKRTELIIIGVMFIIAAIVVEYINTFVR